MTALLLSVGLAMLAFGLLADLVTMGRSARCAAIALAAAGTGALALAVGGAVVLSGGRQSWSGTGALGDVGAATTSRPVATGLTVDHLAGLFLLLVFAVAVPAIAVLASWLRVARERPRLLPGAACLMLLACAGVVLAGDVFVLAASWELLTASFYWLVAVQRRRNGRASAAVVTVGFGKASGAALLLGLLLLASGSGSMSLSDLADAPGGPARSTGYALLVAAFAIKVGIVPVQVWMPRGYWAAPGPARALMAGVAVNVGFYGLWRTLDVLGAPPAWLAVTLLLIGGATALLGIAHASVQTSLARVVAYSSIENAGLIITAYAVALVGAVVNQPQLTAAGLLAASLQMVGHAVAKTLMFSSAGVIESQLGSDDLGRLRGVRRRLPWSGTGLVVASMTMAGLPPGVLFVSEWFILEALMQQFRVGRLALALPMALAGALVALTTGFAGVAFVRLTAFTALGRTAPAPSAGRDVGPLGRAGLVALMLACVVPAAAAPAQIHLLATGLSGMVPAALTDQAVASPWVLGPVYSGFSVLSPTWLAIELPVVLLLVTMTGVALSRGRLLRVRRVQPWRSATGGVDGQDEYTPFGYTNPTRTVLANVLLPGARLHTLDRDDGSASSSGTSLRYEADVVEVTEQYLYRPLLTPMRLLVAGATRLQSGHLGLYLLYMLIALVAVLAVVTGVS